MVFEEGLKLPVKLQELYRTRSKLKDAVRYIETTMPEDGYWDISNTSWLFSELLGVFPKRCRDSSLFHLALHRTLENYLVGVDKNTKLALRRLPSVLSGNLHDLLCGQFFAPPTQLSEADYCLSIIRDVCPVDEVLEKHEVTFELLTGRNASETKKPTYTMYVGSFKKLMKTLGVLGKFAKLYERKHPKQLVGCYAFIKPSVEDSYEQLEKIGSNSTLKSRNKRLMESRLLENRSSWCDTEECGLCQKGLLECELATRSTSYVTGTCPVLNESGMHVNPNNPNEPSWEYQTLMW